ncbi:MAG: glycoside hydrolase family 13 protein [Propionibacteriaceae bacterium]|jgi:alpha-glucosidase|nr:glycoside hydrolase family 13 protein [Propionibacteriaceae bacterium]
MNPLTPLASLPTGGVAGPVPHHDGSPLYVSGTPRLGETIDVFVRLPWDAPYERVALRSSFDADLHVAEAVEDPSRATVGERWFRASLLIHNPSTHYRFMLIYGQGPRFDWLNAAGVWGHEVTDAFDFRISIAPGAPRWSRRGAVYQIFPDRYARGGPAPVTLPEWVEPTPWSQVPRAHGWDTGNQYYGGSLWGIIDHLDDIIELGASTIYLTPFFQARSVHRYDASTFDRVDPLLGGEEALSALIERAHQRGLRVVGDLTTNHTGSSHEWFQAALSDPDAPERDYYLWRSYPDDYVQWLEVPTLPKLDWSSRSLRRRFIEGEDSVVARWLRPPFGLDGWRIDVANQTGRFEATDLNHEVARTIRATIGHQHGDDGLLVAEYMHDPSDDLTGDGWQAVMNYTGFSRPVWNWLCDPDNTINYMGLPVSVPRRDGVMASTAMRLFAARLSWSAIAGQWNNLGSHDTQRFRTLVADDRLLVVGAGLLACYPGVPMVFAGDEWGARGVTGEEGRVTMPWDEPERRDEMIEDFYHALLGLRRDHNALMDGGMRWVFAHPDALGFLRETAEERLLVVAARASWPGIELTSTLIGRESPRPLFGSMSLTEIVADGADGARWKLDGSGPGFSLWSLGAL